MRKIVFTHCNSEELLEMLRICAHNLLLAYDETLQSELWIASEKTVEACASLLSLVNENYSNNNFLH